MKIAQVSVYDMFRPGGVQSHIEALSDELRSRGHEVKIIAPNVSGVKNTRDDVILLGKSTKISLNKTEFEMSIAVGGIKNPIKRMLKKEKFDILHFHEPWTPTLSLQILSESKSVNVGTFHSTSPDTFIGRSMEVVFHPLTRSIVNALDAVIVVSEAPLKYIRKLYNDKVHIVPNGIDLSVFSPDNKPFDKYLDGKVNIFFIGRLDERKGVIYLVKAFRKIKEKFGNVRLIIGGKGNRLIEIQKYIKRHSIKDVEMLGYVEEEDKPRLYATCDIFCSPASYGESFGIVLVEAMATGKPVVACSNPGYKSVLKGRGSLFLAEPRDVDMLAEKLLLLCRDPQMRKMMGEWGLKESQKYSWKNVTDQIEEVYKYAKKKSEEYSKEKAKKGIRKRLTSWLKKLNGKLKH